MTLAQKNLLASLKDLSSDSAKKASKAKALKTLEVMYYSRFADEKMQKLTRQNKGSSFHLCGNGHEMIGAMSALALTPGKDWGFPYYRDRAFALGLGCRLKEIIGAFLGREVPHHSGGRMMPDHFSHKPLRIPCQSSVVGSQFLQAVGLAKGIQLSQGDEIVYVSSGEGATSQGDFHEALNYACLHQLSVIFVVQDNGWAISVPLKEQTAGGCIGPIARGYPNLSVHVIDGCDFEAVSCSLQKAVLKGRLKKGPSLIVAKIPRLGSHSSSDDPQKYKEKKDFEEDQKRDPLPRFEKWLLKHESISSETLRQLSEKIREEVEIAAQEAEKIPFQNSKNVLNHLYKKSCPLPSPIKEIKNGKEPIVIMDALNQALDEEMERDEKVLVYGQDVAGGKGGVFGVTRHLTKKYGKDRCFNTPLAESTIIGMAIGLSVHSDFKPVVEVQFCDYMWTGANQLFNELASYHYRSNGEWHCPIVIRMPSGAYIQGGPYHSQNVESFLCHCPGLKVVMPSNSADAKKLLKGAIRDPNPVIFLEHKALYRQRLFCAKEEPGKEEILPLGKAEVVCLGEEVTLICWGMMVCFAHEIALKLQEEDIAVEVIDLRTLMPLDFETLLGSVKKTGKVLILQEAPKTCGFGAEIAARLSEKGFEFLDAPISRLGAFDVPVSYCKQLEEAILPQKNEIEKAIRKLVAY